MIADMVMVQIYAGDAGLGHCDTGEGRIHTSMGLVNKMRRHSAGFSLTIAQHCCPSQLQRHQGQKKNE